MMEWVVEDFIKRYIFNNKVYLDYNSGALLKLLPL